MCPKELFNKLLCNIFEGYHYEQKGTSLIKERRNIVATQMEIPCLCLFGSPNTITSQTGREKKRLRMPSLSLAYT